MKSLKAAFAVLCFTALPALSYADQVVVTAKNLDSFTYSESVFRPKGGYSAASDFEWYERANVTMNIKNAGTISINYVFPGPKSYQNTKSALMMSLNLIKQNIISYEKLGNSIVCFKTLAFADQQANSLEFTKNVVPCTGK